jgi:hypothetical protein
VPALCWRPYGCSLRPWCCGGQLDVLAFANMHAADKRAQTVAVVAVPSVAAELAGRSLTAIAQDIAKVRIDLAHVDARSCIGDCQGLCARKVALSAQLAALNAEANDAKRFEAEQDRLRDQAARAEELRESRRADPATSLVAPWLGTTEVRLDPLMNFVLVVVLEGVACFCWYYVGLGAAVPSRKAIASDRNAIMLQQEAVAPIPEATLAGRVEQCATHVATCRGGAGRRRRESRSSHVG